MSTAFVARKKRDGCAIEAVSPVLAGEGPGQPREAARFKILATMLRAKSQRLDARLDDLAKLRKTLQTGDMVAAEWDLSLVAEEVLSIGQGVTVEGIALARLIDQNRVLSRQIDSVAGDIRFLAAIVSQARVAIASIRDESGDLESFGRDLETIAANAARTLRDYGVEHATLLDLLETTASRHKAFEANAGPRLLVSAAELDGGAAELSRLRKRGDAAAGELSRDLGQIRDGLHQAAIHCETAAIGIGAPGHGRQALDPAPGTFAELALACLETHADRSPTIVQDRVRETLDGSERLFLDQLGPKLKEARLLFEACREARHCVELLTVKVIPTFEVLNRMAEGVAVMVSDIMVSGANAIVKSHRLGSQGAGLSVIAQHLRSHALCVADGIGALTPLLTSVRALNSAFLETLANSGAGRLTEISSRMGWVVDSFVAADRLSAGVMASVKLDSAALDKDLPGIVDVLRCIADGGGSALAGA